MILMDADLYKDGNTHLILFRNCKMNVNVPLWINTFHCARVRRVGAKFHTFLNTSELNGQRPALPANNVHSVQFMETANFRGDGDRIAQYLL
jgi:hypothetical protein